MAKRCNELEENYEFYLKQDLRVYEGKCIAVCECRIIAADEWKDIFVLAKREFPGKRPLFDYVSPIPQRLKRNSNKFYMQKHVRVG